MKMYGGVELQLLALATLPWGKYPWYPLNRRLGGIPEPVCSLSLL